MKKNYILTLTFLFALSGLMAQTIWSGPNITFTKDDGADWTMEENQDRITDNVWITRANNKGVFNIAQEMEYQGDGSGPDSFGPSPVDTEWAFGRTSDGVENLTFTTWIVATTEFDPGGLASPTDLVDKEMVLHLITDDIYMDIKFLSWAVGNNNGMGGFSYERATEEITSTSELEKANNQVTVFPNPASSSIQILDLEGQQNIEIFNTAGAKVYQNSVFNQDEINVGQFPAGVYYIRLEDGGVTSFIKE